MLAAFPHLEKTVDALASGKAQSAAHLPGLDDFETAVWQTALRGNMAGQLFVRTIEVPDARRVMAEGLKNFDRDAFVNLPFEEAVDAFLQRRIVTPEEFDRMTARERHRAFIARRLAGDSLVDVARRELAKIIEQGGTLRDFTEAVRDGEVSFGVTAADPAYLETVFRTNVLGAYGAGRFRQMTDPAVLAVRRFVEYLAIDDGRARPNHLALNRKLWESSNPVWYRIAPPGGFNCRCSSVMRRAEDVEGREVLDDVPAGGEPDPGFDGPPGDTA